MLSFFVGMLAMQCHLSLNSSLWSCIHNIVDSWVLFIVVVQSLTRVLLFVTPWTATCQAPLSMGFPRQEYWSGLPGDLPDPGIKSASLASPALAGRFFTSEPPGKPRHYWPLLLSHHPNFMAISVQSGCWVTQDHSQIHGHLQIYRPRRLEIMDLHLLLAWLELCKTADEVGVCI